MMATTFPNFRNKNIRKEKIMNKKFGLFILLGLIVGGTFGTFFGPVLGNPLLGVGLGVLGGVFIGWFIAAAAMENKNIKKDK
jgi:uncharacterized protein YcfJ